LKSAPDHDAPADESGAAVTSTPASESEASDDTDDDSTLEFENNTESENEKLEGKTINN